MRRRPAILLLGSMTLALAVAPGCRTRTEVDERLLAALGLAQAYQHQSDELERLGDRGAAVERARQVLEIEFPEPVPEREDVRLDAYGRIAELLLAGGDDRAAEDEVRRGLAEATRTSYFKARLHAVAGRVHQARARRLREEGDEAGARVESRLAIDELETSIELNREVLGLRGDGGARSEEGER